MNINMCKKRILFVLVFYGFVIYSDSDLILSMIIELK